MTIRELGLPTLAALLLALGVVVVAAASDDLAFTFYRFWWLPVFGMAVTLFAAWRTRRPWLLLLLLVLIAPLVPILALLAVCATGDCL